MGSTIKCPKCGQTAEVQYGGSIMAHSDALWNFCDGTLDPSLNLRVDERNYDKKKEAEMTVTCPNKDCGRQNIKLEPDGTIPDHYRPPNKTFTPTRFCRTSGVNYQEAVNKEQKSQEKSKSFV